MMLLIVLTVYVIATIPLEGRDWRRTRFRLESIATWLFILQWWWWYAILFVMRDDLPGEVGTPFFLLGVSYFAWLILRGIVLPRGTDAGTISTKITETRIEVRRPIFVIHIATNASSLVCLYGVWRLMVKGDSDTFSYWRRYVYQGIRAEINGDMWWVLISLVPIIGAIWVLVENGFLAGTDGENRFGLPSA